MASSLSSVTKSWKNFDFIKFQTELDQVATDLAQRQEASEISRKRLIDQNKEFKKSADTDAKKQAAPLLKNFQNEVDQLTNRSKAAEAAFLSVYKKIVETPDPLPSLEYIQTVQAKANRVADLELENGKLRETLAEYNKEFAEVKNQEITIKQLRDKIKELEDSVDSRISTRLTEKERELVKSYEEKNQLISQAQIDLEKRLSDSENKVHALQSAYSAAQAELFEYRNKAEDDQSAKNSEMELVYGDLEIANHKLAAAEKEIAELNNRLASALAAGDQSQSSTNEDMEEAFQRLANTSLEAELVAKEHQIEQLVEENRKYAQSLSASKNHIEIQREKHQKEYSDLQNQVDLLKTKLESQRDYHEVKRELSIMKSVEFHPEMSPTEGSSAENTKPLEQLLLEKNKRLQTESTNLRNSSTLLQERVIGLESQLKEASKTIEEQRGLINQLEQDLLAVNARSSQFRGEADGAPNAPSSDEDVWTEQKLLAAAVEEKLEDAADNTLLSIVSSQRERFKQRNLELETEAKETQQTLAIVRSECERLKADNVQLYEKIRYLQSYSANLKGGQNGSSAVESRYSIDYENKLDPFSTFNKSERQRKYTNLAAFEKITLNVGQLVFSNRTARMVVFIYAMIMHALVFLVLYKYSLGASDIRDLSAECQEQFASHMKEFHHDEHGTFHNPVA